MNQTVKLRKNHSCKPYIIYNVAGEFMCDECGKTFDFIELGLKAKDLQQYYDAFDNPKDSNYEHDLGMMNHFKDREIEALTKENKKLKRIMKKNEEMLN